MVNHALRFESQGNMWINLIEELIKFLTWNDLVVYGSRVGDKNYHHGPKYWSLPYKEQYKIADGMVREYFGFPTALDNPKYDMWFAESNPVCNPYWVIAFSEGEEYAKEVVNGDLPDDTTDYYDEEEDKLLGIRTRVA